MKDKPVEIQTPDPTVPIYTDLEVAKLMNTLGEIYAMDDAIYNQEQLHRPETFVIPLKQIRFRIAKELQEASAKAAPKPEGNT
jgi:hypothetical protein